MSSVDNAPIGHALVEFSLNGIFPEEDISSTYIEVGHLAPALESLTAARSKLQVRWRIFLWQFFESDFIVTRPIFT